MSLAQLLTKGKTFHQSQPYFDLKHLATNELRANENVDIKLKADLNGEGTYGLENVAFVSTNNLTVGNTSIADIIQFITTGNSPPLTENVAAADAVSLGIAPDETAPIADPSGWYFHNTGPPNKINWYFYANASSFSKVGTDLECFYVHYTSTTTNHPWLTAYTLPDGSGDISWYKSRYTMDGNMVDASGSYVIYFSPENKPFSSAFPEKATELAGATFINLYNDYTVNVNGVDSLPTQSIMLLAFSTNSALAADSYDLVAHEAGYKFKGQMGLVRNLV